MQVRLQLAKVLALLTRLAAKAMSAYASETVQMTKALCRDPFHEVNAEACDIAVLLNGEKITLYGLCEQRLASLLTTGECDCPSCAALWMAESLGLRLQPVAKELIAALLPLTTHKRHRVRAAALQAVGRTMHQGAHEMILEMVAFRLGPMPAALHARLGGDPKL
jgi:hypothetical protein